MMSSEVHVVASLLLVLQIDDIAGSEVHVVDVSVGDVLRRYDLLACHLVS